MGATLPSHSPLHSDGIVQDRVLLDLPLSTAFCKLVRGDSLQVEDVGSVDPEVASSLGSLVELAAKARHLTAIIEQHKADTAVGAAAAGEEEDGTKQAREELEELRQSVEGMWLDFTLIGHPGIRLRVGDTAEQAEETVTLESLEEYIGLTTQSLLVDTVMPQVRAKCRHVMCNVWC